MIQEDKELLIKDLCVRLPYGVKVEHLLHAPNNPSDLFAIDVDKQILYCDHKGREEWYKVEFVKPYLLPMSSMTEEEKKDLLDAVVGKNGAEYFQVLPDGSIDNNDSAHQDLSNFNIHWVNFDGVNTSTYIDWFNAHHFDYRNLIGKGLAIAVNESNNPYK